MAPPKKAVGFSADVDVSSLQKACARVMGAVKTASTMAALGAIKLVAERTPEGGRIQVSAYNLEIGLVANIAAKVIGEGVIVLPAKILVNAVSRMPETVVHLAVGDRHRVKLASGTCEMEIAGVDPGEVPELPAASDDVLIELSRETLMDLVAFVESAMSDDDTRYNLNGAALFVNEKTVELVATTGAVFARATTSLEKPARAVEGAIIPRDAVLALKRALVDDDGVISIGVANNSVTVRSSGVLLVARLIDGLFPDHRQVIGLDTMPVSVDVRRATLLEALSRAELVAKDGLVVLDVSGNELVLTARGHGNSTEKLVVTSASKGVVAVNCGYLRGALSVLSSDIARIAFEDLVIVRVTDPENPENVRVIAPMRHEDAAAKAA